MELEPGQQLELNVGLTQLVPDGYHVIELTDDWTQVVWDGPDMDVVGATSNIEGLISVLTLDGTSWYNPSWPSEQNTLKTLIHNEEYWIRTSVHPQSWQVPDYTGNGETDFHYIPLTNLWTMITWDGPDYMPTQLAIATLEHFYRIQTGDGKLVYPSDIAKDRLELLRYGREYSIGVSASEDWKIPNPNDDYLPIWDIPDDPGWIHPSNFIAMSMEELFPYLVHHYVADGFYTLSRADRRALAVRIIQEWSAKYFDAKAIAYGGENGAEPPTGGLTDVCPGPDCVTLGLGMEFHSALRYALFTRHEVMPTNLYFYSGYDQKWHSSYLPYDFGFQTIIAMGEEWLNAFPIDNLGTLDSYVFFQSQMVDGHPGSDDELWPGTLGYITLWTGDIGILLDGRTDLSHATKFSQLSY